MQIACECGHTFQIEAADPLAHRLMCGDSTSAADVCTLTDSTPLDVAITDPPYGIGYEYDQHDDTDNADNAELVRRVFELCPKAKVWTPGLRNLARDIARFGPASVAVWSKKFAAAGNGLGGASTWEPILIVGEPKTKRLANDVIECMTDRDFLADGTSLRDCHGCPKPVRLFVVLMEAFSDVGGTIHEPFSGSGSTIVAADQTGRRCYAMELSPAYVAVALQRLTDVGCDVEIVE